MKKRLTSFVLVLALSFSLSISAFAVDDNDYYSFTSVGVSESTPAMDWPVMPAAEYSQQLTTIIDNLGNISKQITVIQSNQSVLGQMISNLSGIVTNIGNTVIDIHSSMASLASEKTLSAISGKVATESTLSGLHTSLNNIFAVADPQSSADPSDTKRYGIWSKSLNMYRYVTFGSLMTEFTNYLNRPIDGNSDKTLYGYVKDLGDVLANDEDKAIREQQKQNQDTIKDSFLSGSSSGSSLGKDDFSNASQVGGALNDTFNMGGAAKVSDFLSGFGSAGTESQAWFSQTTANNLNAVEASDGTQGVSTFSDDGETMVDVDPDPYNMANIFDRYDWLEGVNMDD